MAKGIKKAVEVVEETTTPIAPNKEDKTLTTETSVSKKKVEVDTKRDYNVIIYGGEFLPEPQIISGRTLEIIKDKGFKIEYVD